MDETRHAVDVVFIASAPTETGIVRTTPKQTVVASVGLLANLIITHLTVFITTTR